MSIYYDDSRKVFHLQSEQSSYVIEVVRGELPAHVYWGPKLEGIVQPLNLVERCSFSPTYTMEDKRISSTLFQVNFRLMGMVISGNQRLRFIW